MTKYLDPKAYIFTDEEWVSELFVHRMASVIQFLISVEELENKLDAAYKIFLFSVCCDLTALQWSCNPFVNSPANEYYRRMFADRLLPRLLQRLRECPHRDVCLSESGCKSMPPNIVDHTCKISAEFFLHLSQCASCGCAEGRTLFYHGSAVSVDISSDFFSLSYNIEDNNISKALEPEELWPDPKNIKSRSIQIESAIDSCFERYVSSDPTWSGLTRSGMIFSNEFWRDIYRADFNGRDFFYKRRILNCITQVVYSRDVDINEHSMRPMTIVVDGCSHGIWNAHVFKMGPDAGDRRCSRLYYVKTADGFHFFQYNGDAHS